MSSATTKTDLPISIQVNDGIFEVHINKELELVVDVQKPSELSSDAMALIAEAKSACATPTPHLEREHIIAWRRMAGEAVVLALHGDAPSARKVLTKAKEFLAVRATETARFWYLSAIGTVLGLLLLLASVAVVWTRHLQDSAVSRELEQPQLVSMESDPLEYREGNGPQPITRELRIDGSDKDYIDAAIVQITDGFVGREDTLTLQTDSIAGIRRKDGVGLVSLEGRSTAALYECVLRMVTYKNVGVRPVERLCEISFIVIRNGVPSEPVVRKIRVKPNIHPLLTIEQTPLRCATTDPVVISEGITVSDDDLIREASVWIENAEGYGAPCFSFADTKLIRGDRDGTRLTLVGVASPDAYQTALRSVTFRDTQNFLEEPNWQQRPNLTVSFRVTDAQDAMHTVTREITFEPEGGDLGAPKAGRGPILAPVSYQLTPSSMSGSSPGRGLSAGNSRKHTSSENGLAPDATSRSDSKRPLDAPNVVEGMSLYAVQILLLACVAGSFGAAFSMMLRITNIPVDPAAGNWAHFGEVVFRLLLGAIGACILVVGMKGNVVLGFAASTSEDVKPYDEFWMIVLFGAVAGASERLVPSFIRKLEASAVETTTADSMKMEFNATSGAPRATGKTSARRKKA